MAGPEPRLVDGKASRGLLHADGTTADVRSKKKDKEVEDDNCIGGLRAPWTSLEGYPGWHSVGQRIWTTLRPLVAGAEGVLEGLGSREAHDFDWECVVRAQAALRGEFALATNEAAGATGIDAELCLALI
eukprot:2935404-Amphidinium_carterae.1